MPIAMAKFIHIQSIQSTSQLGTNINPQYLAQHLPSTLFEPQLPHKIYFFLDQPKTRFTIFRTGGTLVMLGGKSCQDSALAVHKVVEQLHSIGMQRVQYHAPQVNNICSSGYVGFKIHLPHFADHPQYAEQSIYEVDQFPGLRYKGLSDTNRSITATIFHSGKCIITGARHENEILDAYDRLLDISTEFKINGTETDKEDLHVYTNIEGVDPFRRYVDKGQLYVPM